MFKNVGSQKVTLLVISAPSGSPAVPKTGDAANLTAYVAKDDGSVTVLGDTSATELDATNAPGLYSFDLTQSETNADKLLFSGKSSTADIYVVPLLVQTVPAGFTAQVAQTGDSYAIVNSGTYGNSALKSLIDAVDNFVDTEVAAILAAVDTEVASILDFVGTSGVVVAGASKTGYRLSATGVDDIWDEPLAGHTTADTFGDRLRAHVVAFGEVVVDAGSDTTHVVFKTIDGAAASANDDFYNGRVIIFTSGALRLQATSISDYVGATKTAVVVAMTGSPASDVTAVLV